LAYPIGVAVDGGNLLFADSVNHRIRQVAVVSASSTRSSSPTRTRTRTRSATRTRTRTRKPKLLR